MRQKWSDFKFRHSLQTRKVILSHCLASSVVERSAFKTKAVTPQSCNRVVGGSIPPRGVFRFFCAFLRACAPARLCGLCGPHRACLPQPGPRAQCGKWGATPAPRDAMIYTVFYTMSLVVLDSCPGQACALWMLKCSEFLQQCCSHPLLLHSTPLSLPLYATPKYPKNESMIPGAASLRLRPTDLLPVTCYQ